MRREVHGKGISADHKGLSERNRLNLFLFALFPAIFGLIWLVVSDDPTFKMVGLVVLTGSAFILVSFFRPYYLSRSIIVVLGAVPFASIPILGVQLQWVLALVIAYWLAALVGLVRRHPASSGWKPAIWAIYGLLVLSLISYLATRGQFGSADDLEFVKWALSTSLVLIIARQSAEEIVRLLKLFVISTTGAAVYAFASILPDGGSLLNLLGLVGYQRTTDDNQAYFLQNGDRVAARLSGSFVDPNIAALFFFLALIFALILFLGRKRVLICSVLLIGLIATLSRGGMLALAFALILFLIFNRKNIHRRTGVLLFCFTAGVLILAVPVTRQRFLTTFGQSDLGTVDRLESLDQYWSVMSHSWVWGLGWGRPEFRSAAVSYAVNMVANAPLATVYRGGLVAGIGFLVLLLVCAWAMFRLLARGTGRSVLLAGLIGGFVAAIQTGYAVVTIAPMTCLLALVFLTVVRPDVFLASARRSERMPDSAGPSFLVPNKSALSDSGGNPVMAPQPHQEARGIRKRHFAGTT
ncbi:O-antigen ligase family protein [bacterium RCC_150]